MVNGLIIKLNGVNCLQTKKLLQIWLLALFFVPISAWSMLYEHNNSDNDVIGALQAKTVWAGNTLDKIAIRYNVGFYELVEANPHVDPDNLRRGEVIRIPTQFILPNVKREGIVINIAEMRLYYFPANSKEVFSEPIGIGRQGWTTPVSESEIIDKEVNPTWHIPISIRKAAAKDGYNYPAEIPPGPYNPLGKHSLRLSLHGYLIHGTNDPPGVGRRSSAGCIRMYPRGAEYLYNEVALGTPVRIINEPFKIGFQNNEVYLEVHKPLQEDKIDLARNPEPIINKIKEIARKTPMRVNWRLVHEAAQDQWGIPILIGHKALL